MSERRTPPNIFIFIRRWRGAFLAGIVALVVLFAVALGVILFGWGWTGFTGGDSQVIVKRAAEDTIYLPSKTLWDWMQLLLVPVLLAVGGFWFSQFQKNREERITSRRDEVERETAQRRDTVDREIAADNQRETALQSYIDKIGELLLREQDHLGVFPGNPQVENIARARTVTVLHILDPGRRASLLRFLSQAGILRICTEDDLSRVDLNGTNLVEFDLSKFNLNRANLHKANLHKADLHRASLHGADLSEADLSEADLSEADLSEANLNNARLHGAHLTNARLNKASLHIAELSKAMFHGADLSGADLGEADFFRTIQSEIARRVQRLKLLGADLRGAKGLTIDQRVFCRINGALVDPPTLPASSTPRHDGEQGQSPTPAHAAETPRPAGDITPSMLEEDGPAPPTHPGSPS